MCKILAIVFALLFALSSTGYAQTIPLPTIGGDAGAWGTKLTAYLSTKVVFISAKEYGAVCDGVTNDSTAIQAALDAVSSTYGGAVVLPPGTCLLTTGLVVNRNYTSIIGAGWGATILKANAAITILKVTDAAHVVIDGIKFDGNSKTATNCLSFLPTVGATNQYSSVRNVRVTQCQTGILIGATNNFSVVGLSFIGVHVFSNNTGIQQQGINTGDIFYTDGAFTDNPTVGFDAGSSQGASFRGFSTNGQNGAADFRLGDAGNAYLTIEDHIGNPALGPFILANGVSGQQMIANVVMKNCAIGWNGTAGGDIIRYSGQGTFTIIGGSINGDGVVRVSPTQALSFSGPTLIDIGLVLRGSPEPTFVVTGGRRHSIGPQSTNVGTRSGVQTTNMPVIESVQTFTSGDATPSVALGNKFITAGSIPITNFDDGSVGQTIKVRAAGSITITNNANIKLAGAIDFAMTSDDTLTLTQFVSGVWTEDARSVN